MFMRVARLIRLIRRKLQKPRSLRKTSRILAPSPPTRTLGGNWRRSTIGTTSNARHASRPARGMACDVVLGLRFGRRMPTSPDDKVQSRVRFVGHASLVSEVAKRFLKFLNRFRKLRKRFCKAAGAGVNQHTPQEARASVTSAPKLSDRGRPAWRHWPRHLRHASRARARSPGSPTSWI